jgi:hypothetical protein
MLPVLFATPKLLGMSFSGLQTRWAHRLQAHVPTMSLGLFQASEAEQTPVHDVFGQPSLAPSSSPQP